MRLFNPQQSLYTANGNVRGPFFFWWCADGCNCSGLFVIGIINWTRQSVVHFLWTGSQVKTRPCF
jgi:hypothetical protein